MITIQAQYQAQHRAVLVLEYKTNKQGGVFGQQKMNFFKARNKNSPVMTLVHVCHPSSFAVPSVEAVRYSEGSSRIGKHNQFLHRDLRQNRISENCFPIFTDPPRVIVR